MEFLPFFMVLFASVLFSGAFRRFHLPWVLALIVAGVAIGPHGLDLADSNPTIDFLGQIGLIFLMFMAGLETQLSSFREFGKRILILASINGLIPLAVGYAVGVLFGFPFVASLLLGIIFMSSSVAVVMPALEETGLIKKRLGRSIVAATITVDVLSLILLSIVLQNIRPVTELPLVSFYFLLGLVLIMFGYGLPRVRALIPHKRDDKDLFESEVRIVFLMMMGTVVTFQSLGLHPIIAGFFSGLVLSDSIRSEILIEKLRTISYGIFIPIFFAIVGFGIDLSVFVNGGGAFTLVTVVLISSVIVKYASGWLGARFIGITGKDAQVVGIATIPKLSTALAVVYTAVELGILRSDLVTSMVMLSIITTVIAPLALRRVMA